MIWILFIATMALSLWAAARVKSVLVALDATPAALNLCRRVRPDLLITHHPVIFSPVKHVRPDAGDSSAAYSLLRMGVAVISAHTNADVRRLGWMPLFPVRCDRCGTLYYVQRREAHDA